jgi:Mg-chelatase subunit ChlD
LRIADPQLLWILLPVVVLVVLLELRRPGTRARRIWRCITRSAVLAALALALAGPAQTIEERRPRRLVVLVEPAADPGARRETAQHVSSVVSAAMGHLESVEVRLAAPGFEALPTRPGGGTDVPLPREGATPGADLVAALARTQLRFSDEETGAVLVLSPGHGSLLGADATRAALRARHVLVAARAVPDTAPPLAAAPRLDAWRAPREVRGGFQVHAEVSRAGRDDLQLRLSLDGATIGVATLGASGAVPAFSVPAPTVGLHELTLELQTTSGTPIGSLSRKLVEVGEAPRVLAVLTDASQSALRRALGAQGMLVEAVAPADALGALSRRGGTPDLIVMDAASAVALGATGQAQILTAVEAGLGLLLEAGTDVEAWGLLGQMPLGRALPLRPVAPPQPEPDPEPEPDPTPPPPEDIEPPEEEEGAGIAAERRPEMALPITLLLVIDRSGSMAEPMRPGDPRSPSKLAIAIEGARRAAQTLSRFDRVGVITFSDEGTLDFTPRSVTSADEIPNWLASVRPGGGTNIFDALALAQRTLARESTPIQHLVLITDGLTQGVPIWSHVVAPMGKRGVTMTALGIGKLRAGVRAELRRIVQDAASSKVIAVRDVEQLPTIMTRDTRRIANRRRVEAERLDRLRNPDDKRTRPPEAEPAAPAPPRPPQQTTPPPRPETDRPAPSREPLEVVRRHEAVLGLRAADLPRVGPPLPGQRRRDAAVLMARRAAATEPVLLASRRGLGRILEWTLPADDEGAAGWSELGRLFGQAGRAVLAPSGALDYLPRLEVEGGVDGQRLRVHWPRGDTPVGVDLVWVGPDGTKRPLGRLDPTSGGVSRALPAAAPGSRVRIEAQLSDGRQLPPLLYLAAAPSAEPPRAGAAAALAARFGRTPRDLAAFVRGLPIHTRTRQRPLWPLFLWIAAGLLVVDVLAHRRGRIA